MTAKQHTPSGAQRSTSARTTNRPARPNSKAADGKKKLPPDPEQQTVAELLATRGVPLHVQVWLNRFAVGDEYALEKYGISDDPGVNGMAFLIYDTLEAQHDGASVRESSEEARDFVEEWLYTLVNYYGQHTWNNAEAALAVMPYLFDSGGGGPLKPEGDAAYVLLRTAVERLTTKTERREFLRQDAAQEPEKDEETDRRAAFKLSRVLADPRTPDETRGAIADAMNEFSMASRVHIWHPALVRRAFMLMCEAKPKGGARECKKDRAALLALLDALPEMSAEKGGA